MAGTYESVKKEMEKLLNQQEFAIHERLPAEVDMAKRFHVSRVTYRNVVKALEKEGKLYVKHGSGTYVSKPLPHIESSLEILESTGKMIRNAGFRESERKEILEIANGADYPEVCDLFEVEANTKFIKLERYRYADDETVSYSINFMLYSQVGEIFEKLAFSGSLFEYLENNCNIEISCADTEMVAVEGQHPILDKLNTGSSKSIMLLKQLHYNLANEPVLFSYDYLRNDIFHFRIRRRR